MPFKVIFAFEHLIIFFPHFYFILYIAHVSSAFLVCCFTPEDLPLLQI